MLSHPFPCTHTEERPCTDMQPSISQERGLLETEPAGTLTLDL